MRQIISFGLFLLLVSWFGNSAHATHVFGATLTYECLGPNMYRVHHHNYRDCSGTPCGAPTNVAVAGIGGGCTAPVGSGWVYHSNDEITMLAPTMPTTCTGGSMTGVSDCHYTQDFDFTGVTCTQYKVTWGECCRKPMLTNLVNPGSQSTGISTDTIDLSLPVCNSSPVWHLPPPVIAVSNRQNFFDHGATDPDGDSLAYEMATPLDMANSPLAYNLGYSVSSPLGSGWNISLDPETGLFGVNPSFNSLQFAAICIVVHEYRNGVRIGSVRRDFDLITMNSLPVTTQLPSITGPTNLSGAILFGGAVLVPPGGSMCMDFNATDPDVGQATQLSWMSDLPGATLTDTFGAGPDTVFAVGPWARVCWTAPTTPFIDTFYITAIDTTTQLNNMVISGVVVMNGDTVKVWPGDANNDLIADVFDLLPIGLAFGDTGPVRNGASLTWIGQYAFPWLDSITGGIDKKFIDCNGNGTVSATDAVAIALNYGLTHTKADVPISRGTTVDPPLRLILPDSANVGDTISAPIILGDSSIAANNIYGYAFTLHYDASLIDSSTVWIDFDNSWLGDSSNSIDLYHNHPLSADCDGGQVRTTHTTASGMGEVCRAHFVIIDNIDGKRQTLDSAMLSIFFTDVQVIGLDGELIAVDAAGDSMMVYELTVDAGGQVEVPEVSIYPNPAQDELNITMVGQELEAVEVTNVHGQMVMQVQGNGNQELRIDARPFARGMYFVRVKGQTGWVTKRIVFE